MQPTEAASMTFSEIIDAIKERTSDPLLGSFATSYAIVNWQFFYVLAVSDAAASAAMGSARNQLEPGWCWMTPALLALGYTFVYPWFRVQIAKARRPAEVAQANAVQRADLVGGEIKAETLAKHPAYLDQQAQIAALMAELKVTWGHLHPHLASNQQGLALDMGIELLRVDEPMSGWKLPVVLSLDEKTQKYRRSRMNVTRDAVCGFAFVGSELILAVRHTGLVPHNRNGAPWLAMTIEDVYPSVGRPSGLPVLGVVSGSTGWSAFYAV